MKKLCFIVLLMVGILGIDGQNLRFKNGRFKIVQFTDTHICPQKIESQVSLSLIKETAEVEKPDLIVITGDVVTGEPAIKGWNMILDVLKNTQIPFVIINGNHDTEQDVSYEEFSRRIVSTKNCLNRLNEHQELADMAIEIYGSKKDCPASVLYFIDSHSNSTLKTVGGYAWITNKQIAWYKEKSTRYKGLNNNLPIPSLAFFHIPLREYAEAYDKKKGAFVGLRMERECPADINSGLFCAFLEQGDVMGSFVGHDHDNDYIASHYGVSLGYGRFSGGKTTYIDLMPGARIITLYEGEDMFTTYIRLQDGRIIDKYSNKNNPQRDVTFAVLADLHFDLLPETDQYYHVRTVNRLEHNFVWPNDIKCYKGDTLTDLSAVVIAGDIFDKALPETHQLFKMRYFGNNFKDDKVINYSVFPGFGNHDINPFEHNKTQNIRGRAMNLSLLDSILVAKKSANEILNYDPDSRAYSWNIEDVHFVQMHTYAGDNTYCKGNSLVWLEEDLKRYASGNNPVVYIQHYGFDDWAIKWWPKSKREALFDILDKYNVVGFFVGHTHAPSVQTYRGYSIYQVNNAWPDEDGKGSFAVARIKGNDFAVVNCRWLDNKGNFEIIPPYIMPDENNEEWMKEVSDKTRICKLSIPATHDSGALNGGRFLQTQDITIEQQLSIGIRGFDIRLKAENNGLMVYHDTAIQNISWEKDVLPTFLKFLKDHPSEMLIVFVKCEGGSKDDYRKLLSQSMNTSQNKPFFIWNFNEALTMGNSRGKILFVHRDDIGIPYPGVMTAGWKDNVACDMTFISPTGQHASVSLQDEYQHRYVGKAPYKMAATLSNMRLSIAEKKASNRWFVSFASATAIPKDGPKDFADKVNAGLLHELQGINNGCGLVFMDFVGTADGLLLVNKLIKTNIR